MVNWRMNSLLVQDRVAVQHAVEVDDDPVSSFLNHLGEEILAKERMG